MFHVKQRIKISCFFRMLWLQILSRRQLKSFLIQQFFKNVGEVWASSPHLRSKWNCTINEKKNLRENRKNRNCLSNQDIVMRNKVSGAIAIPKASWGCAPALPNRMQVISLRIIIFNHEPQANKKFFDPTIFQKCWRGSGRVALIAARRQRNPCAMLLAHGAGGEKSDSFSRRGEQDRSALWNLSSKQIPCNCSGGTVATKYYLTENPCS